MIKKRFLSMLVLLAAVATGAMAQTTYRFSLKVGTEDASKWQGKAGTGEYQALPLTGLEAGTAVSVKYSGWKLVKSVKAKKVKAAAEATAEDKGKLIGTNGKIYADEAAATAAGTTAVAKIVYIGATGHAYNHGLALALNDETSSGWGLAWKAAIDHCSAKNTLTPVTNATWLLASKAQWEYMMGPNGAGSSWALYNSFNWQSGAVYWSSTEADSDNAWYYGFYDDGWTAGSKGRSTVDVRACLAF